MQVSFDSQLDLPRHVRWGEWDGYAPGKLIVGSVVDWPLVPLCEEYESPFVVQRTLTDVPPGKTVGFFWRRAPKRQEA
jgi:hypothetical protein